MKAETACVGKEPWDSLHSLSRYCQLLFATLDPEPMNILHRHPCSREEDDCEPAHQRHFNVVENLISLPSLAISR